MDRWLASGMAVIWMACSAADGNSGVGAPIAAVDSEAFPIADPTESLQPFSHSENLVISCGSGCRYQQRAQSRVELQLQSDGTASATAEGVRLDSFHSIAGERSAALRWLRAWRGSWSEAKGVLSIHLNPSHQRCEYGPDGESEPAPCPELGLALRCDHQKVIVDEPLDPSEVDTPRSNRRPKRHGRRDARRRRSVELSWVCTPAQRVSDLSTLTSFPWVFGTDREVLGKDSGSPQDPSRQYVAAARLEEGS